MQNNTIIKHKKHYHVLSVYEVDVLQIITRELIKLPYLISIRRPVLKFIELIIKEETITYRLRLENMEFTVVIERNYMDFYYATSYNNGKGIEYFKFVLDNVTALGGSYKDVSKYSVSGKLLLDKKRQISAEKALYGWLGYYLIKLRRALMK